MVVDVHKSLSVMLTEEMPPVKRMYDHAPLPAGFQPEGLTLTDLHPDVLTFIKQVVPPHLDGPALFTHLLYYATCDPRTSMQASLFHWTGEVVNEAIVLVTSVKDLAASA